jgi:hypothetical protein
MPVAVYAEHSKKIFAETALGAKSFYPSSSPARLEAQLRLDCDVVNGTGSGDLERMSLWFSAVSQHPLDVRVLELGQTSCLHCLH